MGGSRETNRGTPAGQWKKTHSTAAREQRQNGAEGRICTIMHKKKIVYGKKVVFLQFEILRPTMKKIMFLMLVAGLMVVTSCTKEKNCRCSVKGSQLVRIITLKGGSCKNIYYVRHYDALDTMYYDTVFCTDYPFEADSLVVYPNHEEEE
jgi:hypothetical protein